MYNELSGSELTALLKEGDRMAFEEIFKRYNDLLYAHAYNNFGLKKMPEI